MPSPAQTRKPTPQPAAAPPPGSRWRRFEALLLRRNVDKNVHGRAVVLLALVYIGVRHLLDGDYFSILYWLDMPIHEAGHFILSIFGSMFLGVAGGTLFQLAASVATAVNFIRIRDDFAAIACGAWLATGLYHVAWYMADARAMAHPHFNPFGIGAEIHDWNYLFTAFGVLRHDTSIARVVWVLATLLLWASIASGAWLLWALWRAQRAAQN
jgi:hypothetical protein